ncbi:MAG: HD domain-containing protein [Candidatus Omnitrophica bacterium]|nr:HD domain-containing protein [Candidatus Omnitrophota bacterium]
MITGGIDYKKELETASKGMIMIHDHMLLIKLLVRMIVRKVELRHAGMILFDPKRDAYVLAVSRGQDGEKVPENFVRFNCDHPLIRIFHEKEYKYLIDTRNALVVDDLNRLIWRESVIEGVNGTRELLHQVSEHMPMLNSVACVPAFYRRKLLAVLLLGEKKDGTKFEQDELDFFAALASDVAMAIRNARLFEDLKREAERSRNLFIQTALALGSAIEAKDQYTHGHTERVTKYSLAIARQMVSSGSVNVPAKFFENLYIAGLLHDIGKIGIPEGILMKKDALSHDEFEIMKTHSTRGAEILLPIRDFEGCIDGVKHHHEHFDGTGYPDGLKGDDIPFIAAIIAVADALDAITTDRPYRGGMSKEHAIQELVRLSGVWFHPKPVQAAVELYEKGMI